MCFHKLKAVSGQGISRWLSGPSDCEPVCWLLRRIPHANHCLVVGSSDRKSCRVWRLEVNAQAVFPHEQWTTPFNSLSTIPCEVDVLCPFRWREWVHQKLNESYKVNSASLINLKPVFFWAQTEYLTLHFPGIHPHCQRPDKSRVRSPLLRDEAHSTAFRTRPPFLVLYFLNRSFFILFFIFRFKGTVSSVE